MNLLRAVTAPVPLAVEPFSLAVLLALGGTLFSLLAVGLFYRREKRLRQALDGHKQKLDSANAALQRELSERQEIERRLLETNTLFEQFMDHLPGGAFVCDEQHRILYINSNYERIYGPQVRSWLGQRVDQVIEGEAAQIMLQDNLQVLKQDQTLQRIEEVPQPDGIHSLLTTKFPIRQAGLPPRVGGIWLDISAQMQAEQKVRRQMETLESLYASIQELSESLDLRQRAEVTVRTCTDVFGADWAGVAQVLLSGGLEPLAWWPLEQGFEIDSTFKWEQTPEFAEMGERLVFQHQVIYFPKLAEAVPLSFWRDRLMQFGMKSMVFYPLISHDQAAGVLVLLSKQEDFFTQERLDWFGVFSRQVASQLENARLYERRRQQAAELEVRVQERTAQLQEMYAELESFTFIVSHDLRAPLRALQGYALALQEDYGSRLEETGRGYADRIVASAARLERLLQDLLSYSRLTQVDLNFKSFPLDTAVQEALTQIESEVEEADAQIQVVGPLPTLCTHRGILVQALVNLIANSIRFTAAGVRPQVTLRGESRPGWFRLWVEDNGIGIARADQERIFRMFERLHGIETYPGSGVGLAIVRRAAERLGGQVGVESELGHGSRFWLDLPQ